MKKCDLMNQLKKGAPTDHLYCSWHKNEKCERISCPYQLTEKSDREKLIEEAENARKNADRHNHFINCDAAYDKVVDRLIAELKKDGSR